MRHRNAVTALDYTLMALADPTRRGILERLSAGDARVTDVAKGFTISLNSVSKHIRLLERAALVERRVVGREHFLRFCPEPLKAAQDWIGQKRAFWSERLKALDELLSAEADGQRCSTKNMKEARQCRRRLKRR